MEQKRKIIPPVYLLLALIAMTGFYFFLPIYQYLYLPYTLSGIFLIVAGGGMGAIAVGAFKNAGTPVVPFTKSSAVVTTGFYKYTRNPMYLGMVIGLLGAALLFGVIGSLIPIPVFVLIIRLNFIRGEERFMEHLFGQEYLNYKSRVRRWI